MSPARLRILVATPFVLTAPPNGGTLRTWAVTEALAAPGHDVVVLAPAGSVLPPDSAGTVVTAGGGERTLGDRVIETLQRGPTTGASARRRLGPAMERLVMQPGFDVALLEHTAAAWALYEMAAAAGIPWIFELFDVEEHRLARAARDTRGLRRVLMEIDARRMRRAERRLLRASALVGVVSDADEGHVRSIGQHSVVVCLNGVPPSYFDVPLPAPGRLWTFTGDLSYGPNVLGLRWLREEVLPRLPPADGRIVRVIGRAPAAEVVRWAALDQAVELVADPPDVLPWLAKTSYCLNPVLAGGGTSLKILEYAAAARPFVSTSFGARGFSLSSGLAHADTAAEFASRMLWLETQPDPAALGRALRDRARERTWARVLAELVDATERLAA